VGPDFIDPGYHALAVGRPSRNLDAWLSGPELIGPLAAHAGHGCDLLVIEGVMGLFDGAADGSPSSTADVAALLGAPVLLVVDASAMSQSVAALVQGFVGHDPRIDVAGVVLNRVGSRGHEQLLRDALDDIGVAVLGVLRRDDRLTWRDRHLGLVPVVERPSQVEAALAGLAALLAEQCDLAAIASLAAAAPPATVGAVPAPAPVATGVRLAVAGGPAFSFTYPDNLEALAAAGAVLVPFDPCVDPALPEHCHGLVAGGGFPEVFAGELAANEPLLADVRRQVDGGLTAWAECGGLLWLCDDLDGRPMAGAIAASGRMTQRLSLGYRDAVTAGPTPLGPAGTRLRGHEFHYSSTEPAGDVFELTGRHGPVRSGFGSPSCLASYLHVHLAGRPDLAEHFVKAASALRVPYTS
jgi:cobyrinic acid a,c-diamide synthase